MLNDEQKRLGVWLNMIEGQKVKTVRTEEAMYICLGQINTLIRQAGPENLQGKGLDGS